MDDTVGKVMSYLEKLVEEYGNKILSYKIYVERPDEYDAGYKRHKQGWGIIEHNSEYDGKTEYFEVAGGIGIDHANKAILICVNY